MILVDIGYTHTVQMISDNVRGYALCYVVARTTLFILIVNVTVVMQTRWSISKMDWSERRMWAGHRASHARLLASSVDCTCTL
jgi:hypothetical protein